MEQQQGLIAILDALGAANYSDEEISRFLRSRESVLKLLRRNAKAKAEPADIDARLVTTFTFNDTVLIVYRTVGPATLDEVSRFCLLLRKFAVDSLAQGILFRGSVSVGRFYVNDDTNTVMGAAVTDAAAWYDRADWIGINATPHASLVIQGLIEQDHGDLDHVLVDYPVPLKEKAVPSLKVINWPKIFVVPNLTPCGANEEPRAKCLSFLVEHGVPSGTESKYFNTMAFYDHCIKLWRKQKSKQRQRRG